MISFVWRKHKNVTPCADSRVNTNYERIASWDGCQCWTGLQNLRDTVATHCCSQGPNYSAMTHPSKTDWHQLSGITHWLQQQVDSGQERFSMSCLHLAMAYRYHFVWKKTWQVSLHWQQDKYQLWANCLMRWMPELSGITHWLQQRVDSGHSVYSRCIS